MKIAVSDKAPETGANISHEATQAVSPLRWIGVFSFTYFSAQVLAFRFPGSFGLVSAIWPAAGIALAALLLSPRRLWPATLGCLFAAGLAANLTTPRAFTVSAGFMIANICETAACAWLITRICGDHIRFAQLREVMALTAAALFINAATSLIGAATASIAFGSPFATSYRTWWTADGLGLLLVTPLIVAWADTGHTRKTVRWGRAFETACLFALGGAATWLSFGHEMAGSLIEVKPYLLPVFVIWAALRIGPRSTVTLLAAFSAVAIACTAAGVGTFPLGGKDSPQRLFSVQVFLGLMELTGLLLASSVAQKRRVNALLNAVVEGTPDAVYVKDRQGRYMLFNSAAARFAGKPASEVLGKDDTALFPPDEAKSLMRRDRSVMASADLTCYEEFITGGAGEPLAFLSTKGLLYDDEGEVTGLFGISREITERKKTDAYRAMSLQVLQILNGPSDLRESIRRVLSFMKTQTGTDAVGLRLQDGEDFPYFAQEGFSEDFLLPENTLTERSPDGGVCRDSDGKASLKCTCGLVISGKANTAHPYFTPGGSFWTNDSGTLLDLAPEQDPRHRPLNLCIHQGYASMALIPIRNKDRIVGLLQLNGLRKGCFTLATVEILEDLASHIGEALMRKQAEESLKESEQRYRSLFSGMTEGFALHEILFDRQGQPCDYRFLTVNPAFETLTGLKAEDLIGKSQRQVLPDEDSFWLLAYSKVALTGEPVHAEHYSPPLQRHFEVFAYRPAPNQFATILSDITERKRIEEAQTFLAQSGSGGSSESFFHALARYLAHSLSMDFVCIDRLEGDGRSASTVAVWCDGHFEDNVTYALKDTPCGDVVGKQVCCFPSRVCELFPHDQVLKDLRAESYAGVTLFDHAGKSVGLIAVIGRVPLVNRRLAEAVLKMVAVRAASEMERLDSEKALRASERTYRAIINASPVPMALNDERLNITFLNPAFVQTFGYTLDDIPTVADWWPKAYPDPEDRQRVMGDWQAEMTRTQKTGTAFSPLEVTVNCKNGCSKTVMVSSTSLRDTTSENNLVVLYDITDRKEAEGYLQKLDKLQSVGTLAGGIAHDFNNVLLGLFGNISLAKEELPKEHPSHAYLDEAEKSMSRAVQMTKQLLTFAKGGVPVKEDVSLGELAEGVARFDLTGSNVSLVYRHDENLWPVAADRGQIQQVVSNLVINARQAMPNGGRLHITLANADVRSAAIPNLGQGRYVRITVRDEGTGIAPSLLDRIFDPYFTTKQNGNGLGLATVWSIITKHGGHIDVVSELGKGTTFTFYLPASDKTRKPEPEPAGDSPPPSRHANILVMDDDASVSRFAANMLTRCGYSVANASDGKEAVEMYKKAMEAGHPFDAVIMDLTIPGGVGGKEAIHALLAIDPGVRAIVSSGYADDPVMANPAAYGFKATVAKPYTPRALREIIARVVA